MMTNIKFRSSACSIFTQTFPRRFFAPTCPISLLLLSDYYGMDLDASKSPHSRAPDDREGNPGANRAKPACPVR